MNNKPPSKSYIYVYISKGIWSTKIGTTISSYPQKQIILAGPPSSRKPVNFLILSSSLKQKLIARLVGYVFNLFLCPMTQMSTATDVKQVIIKLVYIYSTLLFTCPLISTINWRNGLSSVFTWEPQSASSQGTETTEKQREAGGFGLLLDIILWP